MMLFNSIMSWDFIKEIFKNKPNKFVIWNILGKLVGIKKRLHFLFFIPKSGYFAYETGGQFA